MGVGGRTIEEAKENITIHEFDTWMAYMEKRGMIEPPKKENSLKLSSQAKRFLELNPDTVIV